MPACGSRSVASTRSSVVLPAPFGPEARRASAPVARPASTPRSASRSPKRRTRPVDADRVASAPARRRRGPPRGSRLLNRHARRSAGRAGEQRERVRQRRRDRLACLADALGAAGEVDDQRPAPDAGDRPREHPVGGVLARCRAHRLRDPGRLALDHGRASPRASRRSGAKPVPPVVSTRSQPSLVRVVAQRRLDLLALVRDDLGRRRSRRRARGRTRPAPGRSRPLPRRWLCEVLMVMIAARNRDHRLRLPRPVLLAARLLEQRDLARSSRRARSPSPCRRRSGRPPRRPSAPPSRRRSWPSCGPRPRASPCRRRRRSRPRRRRSESGSGCASGISSSVRLAAWMPASRAVPSTSPFGASPRCDRSRPSPAPSARPPAPAPGGRSRPWRPRRPSAPARARRGGSARSRPPCAKRNAV